MILLRVVDLAPEKSAVREALRAPWAVATPETLSRRRNRAGWPGKRPCRDVSTLPALSIGAPTYPLGFSGKPFATVGLGGVLAIGARRLLSSLNKQKCAGEAGSISWGMPGGRIALAIRGGRRPRAGGGEAPKRRRFSSFCLCLQRGASDLRCLCPENQDKLFDLAGRWWVKPRRGKSYPQVGLVLIYGLKSRVTGFWRFRKLLKIGIESGVFGPLASTEPRIW